MPYSTLYSQEGGVVNHPTPSHLPVMWESYTIPPTSSRSLPKITVQLALHQVHVLGVTYCCSIWKLSLLAPYQKSELKLYSVVSGMYYVEYSNVATFLKLVCMQPVATVIKTGYSYCMRCGEYWELISKFEMSTESKGAKWT